MILLSIDQLASPVASFSETNLEAVVVEFLRIFIVTARLDLLLLDRPAHGAGLRPHHFLPRCFLRHVHVFVGDVLQLDGVRAHLLGVGHLLEVQGFWRPDEFIILADEFKIHDAQLLAGIGHDVVLDPDDGELVLACIVGLLPSLMRVRSLKKALT